MNSMNKVTYSKAMLIFIAVFMLCLLLAATGCTSKLQRAKNCAEEFPPPPPRVVTVVEVRDSIQIDTIDRTKLVYQTEYVECPPDTGVRIVKVLIPCKCKDSLITKTIRKDSIITNTVTLTDTVSKFLLELTEMEVAEKDKQIKKYKGRFNGLLTGSILFLLFLIAYFYIRRKMKKKSFDSKDFS